MTLAETEPLTALWIASLVVQGVFTAILGLIVATIKASVARLVSQNDASHSEIRCELSELVKALGQEREARHACAENHAAELATIREDRPRREEIIAHYGSLSQKLGEVKADVGELKGMLAAKGGTL